MVQVHSSSPKEKGTERCLFLLVKRHLAAPNVARCGGDWEALQVQAVEGVLGTTDYQDAENVSVGDAVLFNGQNFQVEVTGIFSMSGYSWTTLYQIEA